MDLLIVNLNKTAPYQVSFAAITLCDCHNLAKCSRDDSFPLLCTCAHHCMRFTTASLPISENSSIISI